MAVDAEHYYRIMVRSDRESWNVRDHHMVDSVEWLARHMGEGSKGLVSAHNTRVGDAWATDTARAGLVNVGQLPRERVGDQGVLLIGFASHRGSVLTAPAWGEPEHALDVPVVRVGSHEVLLHTALGAPAVPEFDGESTGPWSSRGHRAIGVVNDPGHEAGTYVPIRIGGR